MGILSSYQVQKLKFVAQHPIQYKNLAKLKKSTHTYSIRGFYETRSIFVHVPKAAGVSVSKELYGNLAGGHRSLQEYRYLFREQEFNDFYKFAFVRNPWDRLFSAYHFLRSGGFGEKDRIWFENNLKNYQSFKEFILCWLDEENIKRYDHFKPQSDLLTLTNNDALPLNFLGFFENLEHDFIQIRNRVRPEAKLSHHNKTEIASSANKQTYKEAYTEQMIEKISMIYARDIRLFGYSFDNASLKKQISSRDEFFQGVEK